jgi:hypothetical protein
LLEFADDLRRAGETEAARRLLEQAGDEAAREPLPDMRLARLEAVGFTAALL